MSYRTYLKKFTLLCALLLTSLAAVNYALDIYGVLRGDFSQPRLMEPNQHFVKMKYLLHNKDKYNAFLFGSSRVGNIDLQPINNDFSYYNMTYSEGLPDEWLNDLRILLKQGVPIRQILLGLDDFSFRIDPQRHDQEIFRIPYTEENFSFYSKYLFYLPRFGIIKTVYQNEAGSFYDIYDTGRPLHEEVDRWIEAHPQQHAQDKKFSSGWATSGERIAATLQTIQEIKRLAEAHQIELIVWINPIYRANYDKNNRTEFNAFKQGLAEIVSYYDFSGLNQITTNPYYYYETSHYRPIVGDMIIRRIFSAESFPENFGAYVTNRTVAAHLAALAAQDAQYGLPAADK